MALFEWKDSFSVGIESIDNDHKGLINIINDLFDAISHGMAKEHISSVLAKLIDYTKTHFKREEAYFEKTNYPLIEEHKQQHDLFINKINNLQTDFEKGNQTISVELLKFLTDWLVNHILSSDRKYKEHFKKYGLT